MLGLDIDLKELVVPGEGTGGRARRKGFPRSRASAPGYTARADIRKPLNNSENASFSVMSAVEEIDLKEVQRQLAKVVDPEIGMPIVEMNLIDKLEAVDGKSTSNTTRRRHIARPSSR